ncbi:glutaredoxin family protein [Mycetocola saprophilus]|uniref:glutaredoxin family protein n=1 Tax=Mycetocola saprophilus TaxID=76636 RepID=UPI003BF305A5
MTSITLYTTPGCIQCGLTRKVLDARAIAYDLIDLTTNPTAHAYVTATLGYRQAPVIVTENTTWSGFRPDLLNALPN